MKKEETVLDTTAKEEAEIINNDEMISDYSFFYKIRQMNMVLDLDKDNYGFCWEAS